MDTVIFLLITMAFSAFFSGMEIAFVSVDKLRFEMERKSGVTSGIISYFLRNPNNFISTMLVGNNNRACHLWYLDGTNHRGESSCRNYFQPFCNGVGADYNFHSYYFGNR